MCAVRRKILSEVSSKPCAAIDKKGDCLKKPEQNWILASDTARRTGQRFPTLRNFLPQFVPNCQRI